MFTYVPFANMLVMWQKPHCFLYHKKFLLHLPHFAAIADLLIRVEHIPRPRRGSTHKYETLERKHRQVFFTCRTDLSKEHNTLYRQVRPITTSSLSYTPEKNTVSTHI